METAEGGYYIKNKAAEYKGKPQYIEFYNNQFTAYSFNSSKPQIYTFRFFKLTDEVTVLAPTADPAAGAIKKGTTVKLSTLTEGAKVYYKIGEDAEFAEYTAPIAINEDCTIYAYAEKDGTQSATVEFEYLVYEGMMSIRQALAAGDVESAKVVGQLVYRFGNFGSINSAVLQAKIGDEIYALQAFNSLDSDTEGNPIEIGDWLVMEGKLGPYGGVQQIQSMTTIRKAEPGEIIGEDATEVQVFEDFSGINDNFDNLLTEYVLIKNVTLGEYKSNGSTTVKDAENNSMPIYRAAPYPEGVEAGDVVNLYACVSKYGTTKQLRNGSSTDYVPTNDTKAPVITRLTNAEAEVGKPYTFTVKVEDASGVSEVRMEVFDENEAELAVFENVEPNGDGEYTIKIPANIITGGNLTVTVTATDAWTKPNTREEDFEIVVVDLPQIVSYSPEANSATGDDKRPVISVTFANCLENPAVEMTLNGEPVNPVVDGNTATYTPAADMEDGKVVVWVRITRTDGRSYETNWSFTVGIATF
ncbi:MAG: chitobiase/beta-hexosaminidase C-terminal domain-containing protein, partial [Clostridia bacterium]|nr:chitobiase/beta-hexosaminidase C-terminal domain-containing protein [Clostridia bacterium]